MGATDKIRGKTDRDSSAGGVKRLQVASCTLSSPVEV